MPIFINNKWQEQIPDYLMALLSSGQGLFETILYQDGILWFWELHQERLFKSLDFFNLVRPKFDLRKYLLDKISKVKSAQPLRIRLMILFPFDAPPTVIQEEHLILHINTECADFLSPSALRLKTLPSPYSDQNPLIGHKTLAYTNLYFGRSRAMQTGYDDVLYYNSNSLITETSYSNIFAVKGDSLFTPNIASGILPGTVRGLLVENLRASETDMPLDKLGAYDYFFASSSVKELRLVGQIDNVKFKIKSDSFTKIQQQWEAIKSTYLSGLNRK